MHFRKDIGLRDEHDWKAGKRRSRFDGIEVGPRDHEASGTNCRKLGLSVDVRVLSAHRTPEQTAAYVRDTARQAPRSSSAARAARPTWLAPWRPTPLTR